MDFRVQVTDLIDDQVFYERTMQTKSSSRGDVVDELARIGLQARSVHMEKLSHKLDRIDELTNITKSVLETVGSHIKGLYKIQS